ncbi:MAG: hypothetical protein LBT21_06245 [Oscillospiraceae bacterium]|jgi:hypothetical protein|nr:hypothetical protein [Oscillospiraceae bacterium]
MGGDNGILQLIRGAISAGGGGIISCAVISVEPLELQGIHDEKFWLDEGDLIIPARLSGENAPKPGDTVYVLSLAENSFYLLDKG